MATAMAAAPPHLGKLDALDGAASAKLIHALALGILSEGAERDLYLDAVAPVLAHIAGMHSPPPTFMRRGPVFDPDPHRTTDNF